MLPLHLPNPNDSPYRVLCLGAHSDDIEIGCGGTILSLLKANPRVSVRWEVFSSSGSEERAFEAKLSAAAYLEDALEERVTVHGFRDGYFPMQADRIKDEFETIKKQFQPDLVLTHYRDDRHQDHRVMSDLAWNTFRNHFILEYEIPKYDGDLGQPNFFVPIEATVCERKIQKLLDSFGTQRSKQWFDAETFQSILRLRGMEANSPTRFAEAFYARKAVLGLTHSVPR